MGNESNYAPGGGGRAPWCPHREIQIAERVSSMKKCSESSACGMDGQPTAARNVFLFFFLTWDYSQQRMLCMLTGFKDVQKYARGHFWLTSWVRSVPGIWFFISCWLWLAKGKVGVAARPRQAYLVSKALRIAYLMPKPQPRRWGAPKGQVRSHGREHLGEGRTRCRNW